MTKMSGPVRQRYALGVGEKVDVGGGKPAKYASGGELTLEQKRNPRKAAEMAAYARGERSASSEDDGILAKAAKAVRKAITGDEGMKRGGKVHSDTKQDRAMIDKAIKKAKIAPGMKRGGATCKPVAKRGK